MRKPDQTFAVVDHYVPTVGRERGLAVLAVGECDRLRAGVAGTFWVDPKTGADVPMPPGGAAGYAQPAVARGKLAGFMTVGGGVYHLNWGDIGVTAASGDDGGQVGFDFAIAGGLIHWPYGRWAQAFSGCHPQDDEYHPCAPDWRTDLGAVPGPPAAVW